jgi:hypothetical protein
LAPTRQSSACALIRSMRVAARLAWACLVLPLLSVHHRGAWRGVLSGVAADEIIPAAVDPYAFVEASVPRLASISGGQFGTAIALDETSGFPLASAPVATAAQPRGAVFGFVTFEEFWFADSTVVESDVVAGDLFGASLFTAGNLSVVGAPRADNTGTDQGAVYVRARVHACLHRSFPARM